MKKLLIASAAGAIFIMVPILTGGCMMPPLTSGCCCCTEEKPVAQPAQENAVPPAPAASHIGVTKITAEEAYKPIYFDFDQDIITPESEKQLNVLAHYMRENPDVHIQIAGNCDPFGSAEYNMDLGERRAAAAREFLSNQGISASRVDIVSYGKSRLVKFGCTTIVCNAPNRRDEFKQK